jgi:AraC-like DNA-binding protein
MSRTLLVIGSPQLAPYLATREGYHVCEVDSWAEAAALAVREPPSTMVLADPFATAEKPDPHMLDFLQRMPSLPVVIGVDLATAPEEATREILQSGISEVVDLGIDRAPDALWSRLNAAHARPFKRRLDMGLSHHAQARARILIHAAAAVAVDNGFAEDFARLFNVQVRTIAAWCRREALPPPRRLLTWMRVLLALMLLEEPDRTWRNVATCCGYADDPNLRRALTSMLGPVATGHARRRWTFARGMAAFDEELRNWRERVRSAQTRRSKADL